jgi:hypothetical protein
LTTYFKVPYIKIDEDNKCLSVINGFSPQLISPLHKSALVWFLVAYNKRKSYKGSVKMNGVTVVVDSMEGRSAFHKTVNNIINEGGQTFNKDGLMALCSFIFKELEKGFPCRLENFFPSEELALAFVSGFNKNPGNSAKVVYLSSPNQIPSKHEKPVTEKTVIEDDFFFVEDSVNNVLTFANAFAGKFGYVNVLITGASGFGKTTIAKKFAEKTGRKFVKVDLSLVAEPSDFLGTLKIVEGSTVFVETPFTEAIKEGGFVILLDEINRAYPNITNPLLGLLDDTHSVTYNGNVYTVAPNTIFIVTSNVGSQYTGTFKSDAALLNRMHFTCSVGSITPVNELNIYTKRTGIDIKSAQSIVSFLGECRSTLDESGLDFSPRTGLALARTMSFGASLRFAVDMILPLSLEERKEVLDILSKKGHVELKNSLNLLF